MTEKSLTIRIPKKWLRISGIVGITALVVAPLTAVATHTFDDVTSSHTFHADIEWLEASGVTRGCNPPDNTAFCPDDSVTRGQMSAFMRRFAQYMGAEDGTPAQADHAVTAGDANTLDGKDSTQFIEVGDIEITQNGPWVISHAGIDSSLEHYLDGTLVRANAAGNEVVYLALDTPRSIASVTYGLASVKTCYRVSAGSLISAVNVFYDNTVVVLDGTDRTSTSTACFTINVPPTVIEDGVIVAYQFSADGINAFVRLVGATATWTPTTASLASSAGEDLGEMEDLMLAPG